MGQVLLRGPNAGPICAQHIHPSLRQTPRVAMLKGLLFRFDTPYVLANVCEAVPEAIHCLANAYYQIQKKRRRRPLAAVIKIQIYQVKRPVRYICVCVFVYRRIALASFLIKKIGQKRIEKLLFLAENGLRQKRP
jgi:hypothetical protein